LRHAALATKGTRVTNSESLELIAQAFGVADWNTLSATIREEAAGRNNATTPPRPSTIKSGPPLSDESGPVFSTELSSTLDRALAYANHRKHEYTTLEHPERRTDGSGQAAANAVTTITPIQDWPTYPL
jgi:hypothetical protein